MFYVSMLSESCRDLKDNFSLLIPDLILLGMNIALALIFLLINGDLFGALLNNPDVLFKQNNGNILDLLNSVKVQNNLVKLILIFIGFVVINFFFGAGLLGVKYGMIKNLVSKKKISFIKNFRVGKDYIFKIIEVKIFVFILITLLTLFLNFIFTGFVSFNKSAYFLLTIYLLIKISFFFVNLFLLFRYPSLFLGNDRGINAIKNAFFLTVKKPKFVIFTWMLIFLITTFVSLVFSGVFGYLAYIGKSAVGLVSVTILFYLFRSFINLIITVWMDIYLFKVYFEKL